MLPDDDSAGLNEFKDLLPAGLKAADASRRGLRVTWRDTMGRSLLQDTRRLWLSLALRRRYLLIKTCCNRPSGLRLLETKTVLPEIIQE